MELAVNFSESFAFAVHHLAGKGETALLDSNPERSIKGRGTQDPAMHPPHVRKYTFSPFDERWQKCAEKDKKVK